MRIKSIEITLEQDEEHTESHATTLFFEKGRWTVDGPVYSRFMNMAHKIWQVARESIKE